MLTIVPILNLMLMRTYVYCVSFILVAMLPFWGDWQSWSSCSYNCTNGGRIQTRTRHTLCSEDLPCSETRSETESRPCNAVQFAGKICYNCTG